MSQPVSIFDLSPLTARMEIEKVLTLKCRVCRFMAVSEPEQPTIPFARRLVNDGWVCHKEMTLCPTCSMSVVTTE